MSKLISTRYVRWLIFIIISILLVILSNPAIIPDTLLFLLFSFLFFFIHSFYRDPLFLYVGSISIVASIVASSMGRDPFYLYTILIYMAITSIAIIFIVFSWEQELERHSVEKIITTSGMAIIISILFILALSSLIIIERNIITYAVMIVIIVFSLYFILDSIER